MKDIKHLRNAVIDPVKLRQLRGSVSREIVGEQIGVGTSQVANYENGERVPSGNKLLRLMLLYNVKPEDIATAPHVGK